MPTYEYQCSKCNHQFDAFQKMTEAPLTACPVCHEASLSKLISPVGFQLKGGGWYATDYKPQQKAAAEDNKPAEDKATDGKTGSDQQPQSKDQAEKPAAVTQTVTKEVTKKDTSTSE